MELMLDIFNDISYLDRRCPGCQGKVDYDVTTEFDSEQKTHKCKSCGSKVD